jgi:dihydrodipicolinate synthase/N-acetylneuraminate lyase
MIQGLWVALPNVYETMSPLGLKSFINTLFDRGADGLFVLGTTGLGPDYSVSMRKQYLEAILAVVPQSSSIVVNVSANSSQDARQLAEHAISLGIKQIALTPPFYGRYKKEELLTWLDDIVSSLETSFDLYMYIIPVATMTVWDPEILSEVQAKVIKISGIKYSNVSIAELNMLLQWSEKHNACLLVGDERMTLISYMLGGSGVVSGLASIHTEKMSNLVDLCKRRRWEQAIEAQKLVNELLLGFYGLSLREVTGLLARQVRNVYEHNG